MVGDISAPRVIIVDGASFRGRIDMGEVDIEGERAPAAPRAAAAPARTTLRPSVSAPARPAPRPEPRREEKAPAPAAVAAPPAAPRPPAPPAPVAMGAVKRKVIVKRK